MAKLIQLSIKTTYVNHWGRWQAIREIIQNAKDAEIQNDAPMTIEYVKRQRDGVKIGTILITNAGVTIPEKALLLGHTTKSDDPRMAGKFGEGLDLALLAGVRSGLDIKIRNGSQVWIPVITFSNEFKEDVLSIRIEEGRKSDERVQFEILGISENEWEQYRKNLLFLNDDIACLNLPSGQIILSEEYIGKIFVKGIYVGKRNGETQFGYNFNDAEIDRDRKMVNDVGYKVSKLLSEALSKGKLVDYVYDILKNGTASEGLSWAIEDEDLLVAKFKMEFGDAIPVCNEEEAESLVHFGTRGVVVPYQLRTILERKLGSSKDAVLKAKNGVKEVIANLTIEEEYKLQRAMKLIIAAQQRIGELTPIQLADIEIVEFYNDQLLGTYNTGTGKINLARKLFADFPELIVTLIHECSHKYGISGKGFDKNFEEMTREVFRQVL